MSTHWQKRHYITPWDENVLYNHIGKKRYFFSYTFWDCLLCEENMHFEMRYLWKAFMSGACYGFWKCLESRERKFWEIIAIQTCGFKIVFKWMYWKTYWTASVWGRYSSVCM